MKRMTLAGFGVLALSVPLILGGLQISSCGLYAEDFTQIASGGIDDRRNSYPWGMEQFDGDGDGTPEIYIGTWGNALCKQTPAIGGFMTALDPNFKPPLRWQCANAFWNPTNPIMFLLQSQEPGRIFRGTYDEPNDAWTWDKVLDPTSAESGGFRGARVFDGALYMLESKIFQGIAWGGAQVWKTTDGENYTKASPAGMVGAGGFRGGQVFDGKLYVAYDLGSAIFASADPSTDPNSWEQVNSTGFVASGGGTHASVSYSGTVGSATATTLTDPNETWGTIVPYYHHVRITAGTGVGEDNLISAVDDPNHTLTIAGAWSTIPDLTSEYEIYALVPDNGMMWQLGVFDGHLYAASNNDTTGAEVWKSADPAPGNWTRVISGAYGSTTANGYMTLRSYGDHLYLGTVIYPGGITDFADVDGCEVLRIDADDNVELLVGATRDPNTPGTNNGVSLSGLGAGFDYPVNNYSWYMVEHDGWFYVGTMDMAMLVLDMVDELFPGGIPPEFEPLLDLFFGPDEDRRGGFDLWRTKDGIDWVPVVLDGFGDRDRYGIRNMMSTEWGLVVGAANPVDGFEVWLGKKE